MSSDRWLEDLTPGARRLEQVSLKGGVSAEVERVRYAAGSEEHAVVVRRRPGVVGEEVVREATLCSTLHERGLPVPRALLADPSGARLGAPGWVMPWVEGTTDVSLTSDRLQTLAGVVRGIHATPLSDLPTLPTRHDPLPELLTWLHPDVAWLAPRLRELRWERVEPVLVHGDLWSGNLLWREDRLVAVLDWEDAAIGDPLSDLAGSRLEMVWREGLDVADAWLALHDGVDRHRLAVWELYVACAAWTFMGDWGWPEERLTRTRQRTVRFIEEAAQRLRSTV